MYIEFVKDHFSGIPNGTIMVVEKNDAARLLGAGFAKETTKKAFDDYVKTAETRKEEAIKALEAAKEVKAKEAKKEEDAIRKKVKKQLEDRRVAFEAEQKVAADKEAKQKAASEKVAKEKADEIAAQKEESRLQALEQKIRQEEEAKLS
jgi:hypothetical protein